MVRIVLCIAVSLQASFMFPAHAETPTAPWCGEFLPMITDAWVGAPHRQVHFAPKYCNKIMVNGAVETIPPAIAVLSGGIGADVTNTCVDKMCGQPLAPDMLYRVYVFKDEQILRINFSPSEHKEGPHGNEVHSDDPSQSFIGLVKTEKSGLVCGGMSLCVLSWFYRGHTGLGNWIGPQYGKPVADVCAPNLQPVPSASVIVLTFGINSTFRQGYTVPNIYATGTVTNTEVGKAARAAIAIEWGGTPVRLNAGSPGAVEWSHFSNANVRVNTAVSFTSDKPLPPPLTPDTVYYVQKAIDTNRFAISSKPNGTPIVFESPQLGNVQIAVLARQAGPITTFIRTRDVTAGTLHAVAIGALGAEEGWIKGSLMLGAPDGGCARVDDGMIYTSPHHS